MLDLAQRQCHDTAHLAFAHYTRVQTRFYSGDLIGAEEQLSCLNELIRTVGLKQIAGIAPITME